MQEVSPLALLCHRRVMPSHHIPSYMLLCGKQVGALDNCSAGTAVRWEHRVEAWRHPKVRA